MKVILTAQTQTKRRQDEQGEKIMQQAHSQPLHQGTPSRIWQAIQGAYGHVQTSTKNIFNYINPITQAKNCFSFYNTHQAQMRAPLQRNRLAEITQYFFQPEILAPVVVDVEKHLEGFALPALNPQESIEDHIQTCIEVANTQRQSLEDLKHLPSPIEGFNAQIDSVQKKISTLQEQLKQPLSRQNVAHIYQSLGHLQSGIAINQLCQTTTENTNVADFIQQKITLSQQKQGEALSQVLSISYQRPRILQNMQIIWPSLYQTSSFFKPFQTILNQIETAHQAETGHPFEKSTPIANSRFLAHFLNSINTKNISVKEHDYSPNSQTLQNFIPRISELLTEREWRTLDSNMPKETQEALAILERLFSGEHLNIQETDSLETLIPHLAQLETALTRFSSHHPSHTYGFFNYYIKNTLAVYVWQQKALPSMQKGQELLHWVSGVKNACAQMHKAKETIEALAPSQPNTTLPKTKQPNTTLSPQAWQEFLTKISPLKPHLSSAQDAFSHLMAPITQQQTLIQQQTALYQLEKEIHDLIAQNKDSPKEAFSVQKQLAARFLWLSAADIVSEDTSHLARDTLSSLKTLDNFVKASKQPEAVSKQLTASPFLPQNLSLKATSKAISVITQANTYKEALPVFECVQAAHQNEASNEKSTTNNSTTQSHSVPPTEPSNTNNLFYCLTAAKILNGFKIAATQMASCFSLGCGKNAMHTQYPPATNQNAHLKKQQKEQAQETFQLINQQMFGHQTLKDISSTGHDFYHLMQEVSHQLKKTPDTLIEWNRKNPYIRHFNEQFLASAQKIEIQNIDFFKRLLKQIEQGDISKAVNHLREMLATSMLSQDKAQRPALCSLIRSSAEQLNFIAFYQMHLSISKALAVPSTSTKNQLTPTQQETILANVQRYTQTLKDLTTYLALADKYSPAQPTDSKENTTSEHTHYALNQYKSFLYRATLLSPETIAQEIYHAMTPEKKEHKASNTENETTHSSGSRQTDSARQTEGSTAANESHFSFHEIASHPTCMKVSGEMSRCWARALWFNVLLETPADTFLKTVIDFHQRYQHSALPFQGNQSFFRKNNFPQRMREAYPRLIQQMSAQLTTLTQRPQSNNPYASLKLDTAIEDTLCDLANAMIQHQKPAQIVRYGQIGSNDNMIDIAHIFGISVSHRMKGIPLLMKNSPNADMNKENPPENNQVVIQGGIGNDNDQTGNAHFEIFIDGERGTRAILQKLAEKRLS